MDNPKEQASLASNTEPLADNSASGFAVTEGQGRGTEPLKADVATTASNKSSPTTTDNTAAFKAEVAAKAANNPNEDFSISKKDSLKVGSTSKITTNKTTLERQIDATNEYNAKVESGEIPVKLSVKAPNKKSALRENMDLADNGAFADSAVFNTILPFEALTKNDDNINYYSDQSELRAANQSFLDKAANGTLQGLANIGLNLVRDVGYLGGMAYGAIPGVDFWEAQKNNIVAKAVDDLVMDLDKALPLYKTREEQENPFTVSAIFDSDFLFGTVIKDALPFLASSYIEGVGIGKLFNASAKAFLTRQLGADAVALIEAGQVGNSAEDLAKVGIMNARNVGTVIREGTSLLLNSGEAFMEAGHAYEDSKERIKAERLSYLKTQNENSFTKRTEEDLQKEAETYAEKSATDIFKLTFFTNLAILRATDIVTPLVLQPYALTKRSGLFTRVFDNIADKISGVTNVSNKFTRGLKVASNVVRVASGPLKEGLEEVSQSGASAKYKDLALTMANTEKEFEEKNFFEMAFTEGSTALTSGMYGAGSQEWAVEYLVGGLIGGMGIKQSIKDIREKKDEFKRLKDSLAENIPDYKELKLSGNYSILNSAHVQALVTKTLGPTALDEFKAAGEDKQLQTVAFASLLEKLKQKDEVIAALLVEESSSKGSTLWDNKDGDAYLKHLYDTTNYQTLKIIAAKTGDINAYSMVAKAQAAALYWDYKQANKSRYLKKDLDFALDKIINSGFANQDDAAEINKAHQSLQLDLEDFDEIHNNLDKKYFNYPPEVKRNLFLNAVSQKSVDATLEKLKKENPVVAKYAENFAKRKSTLALVQKADELGLAPEVKASLDATAEDLKRIINSNQANYTAEEKALVVNYRDFLTTQESLRENYAIGSSLEMYNAIVNEVSKDVYDEELKKLTSKVKDALIMSKVDKADRAKYLKMIANKKRKLFKFNLNFKSSKSATPPPTTAVPLPPAAFNYDASLDLIKQALTEAGLDGKRAVVGSIIQALEDLNKTKPIPNFILTALKAKKIYDEVLNYNSSYILDKANGIYDMPRLILDSFLEVVDLTNPTINEAFKKNNELLSEEFIITHLGVSPKVVMLAKFLVNEFKVGLPVKEVREQLKQLNTSPTIKTFSEDDLFYLSYSVGNNDLTTTLFALLQTSPEFAKDNQLVDRAVPAIKSGNFTYANLETEFIDATSKSTDKEVVDSVIDLIKNVTLALAEHNDATNDKYSTDAIGTFAFILNDLSAESKEYVETSGLIGKVVDELNRQFLNSYNDIDKESLATLITVEPVVEPVVLVEQVNNLEQSFNEGVEMQDSISFAVPSESISFRSTYRSMHNKGEVISALWKEHNKHSTQAVLADANLKDPGLGMKTTYADSGKVKPGTLVRIKAVSNSYTSYVPLANSNNMTMIGQPLSSYDNLTFQQLDTTSFVITDENNTLLGALPDAKNVAKTLKKLFKENGETMFEWGVIKTQLQMDLKDLYARVPQEYLNEILKGLNEERKQLKGLETNYNFSKLLEIEYISLYIDKLEVLKKGAEGLETTVAFKTDGWYLGEAIVQMNGTKIRTSPNNRRPASHFFKKNKEHAKGAFFVKLPNVTHVTNSLGTIVPTELESLVNAQGSSINFNGAIFMVNRAFDGTVLHNDPLPLLAQSYSFNQAIPFEDNDKQITAIKTGLYRYLNAVMGNDAEALAQFKALNLACNVVEARRYLNMLFNANSTLGLNTEKNQTVTLGVDPKTGNLFLKVSKVGTEEFIGGQDALNALFDLYVNYNLEIDKKITGLPTVQTLQGIDTFNVEPLDYDIFISNFIYPVKNIDVVGDEYIIKHSYRISLNRPWMEEKEEVATQATPIEVPNNPTAPSDIDSILNDFDNLSISFSDNPLIDGFDNLVVQEQAVSFFVDSVVKYFEANNNSNINLAKTVVKKLIDNRITMFKTVKTVLAAGPSHPSYEKVVGKVKDGSIPTGNINELNVILDTLDIMVESGFERLFDLASVKIKEAGFKLTGKSETIVDEKIDNYVLELDENGEAIDYIDDELLEEDLSVIDGFLDGDNDSVAQLFSDGNKLKLSDKRNIKGSLYRILSNIPKYKNGKKVFTAFGFVENHSFDDLYNLIRGALKNAPADFDTMMEILLSKATSNPELVQVVEALKASVTKGFVLSNNFTNNTYFVEEVNVERKDIQQLKNQFVIRFASQEAETHFVKFEEKEDGNTLRVLSSNANAGYRQVLKEIEANQKRLAADEDNKLFSFDVNGDIIVNKTMAIELAARMQKIQTIVPSKTISQQEINDPKSNLNRFITAANYVGIPLKVEDFVGENTLNTIYDKRGRVYYATAIVNSFYQTLKDAPENYNISINPIVTNNFYLTKLAQAIAEKYNYNSSQYLNVAGEKVQTTTQPNYLFNRLQEILDPNNNTLEELLSIPGYKNSTLLKFIKENRNNPTVLKEFIGLSYLDGFKTEDGGFGLSDMDDISFTITALHLFSNNNLGLKGKNSLRIGKVATLTFSDKSMKPIFTAPLAATAFNKFKTKYVNGKVVPDVEKYESQLGVVLDDCDLITNLRNVVLDEIDRISHYASIEMNKKGPEMGLTEKDLIGGRYIYSFTELNKELKNKLYSNYTIEREEGNRTVKFSLSKDIIDSVIRNTLAEQANIVFKELVKNGIIVLPTTIAKETLDLVNLFAKDISKIDSSLPMEEQEKLKKPIINKIYNLIKNGVTDSVYNMAPTILTQDALNIFDTLAGERNVPRIKDEIDFQFLDRTVLEPYNLEYGDQYTDEEKVKMFLVDFVGNETLVKLNMFQLFGKTPAHNYKGKEHIQHEFVDPTYTYEETVKNQILNVRASIKATMDQATKRMAGLLAPGDANVDKENKNYIFLEDIISNEYDKEYQEKFGIKGYGRVNLTDAAEIISYPEYIKEQYYAGHITDEEYNKAWRDYESGAYEALDYVYPIPINAIKPVYYNSVTDAQNGVVATKYIKSAAFVLIPQLTTFNPEFDRLRNILEGKSDLHIPGKTIRLAFVSGVKEGASNSVKLFNRNADGVSIDVNAISNSNINSLPAKGYLIQQQVPIKPNTNQVSLITQMNKMLMSGNESLDIVVNYRDRESGEVISTVVGKDLQEHYDSLRALQLKIKFDTFIKEFKDDDSDYVDAVKIQQLLLEECLKRNIAPNVIEQLSIKDGKFNLPLLYNSNIAKIESLLGSIIEARVIKQKVYGKSYVQFPGDLFLPRTKEQMDASGLVWVKDKNGNTLFDPKKGLRHTSTKLTEDVVNEDGSITVGEEVVTSAQIILPFDFFDHLGSKLNINDILTYDENGKAFIDLKNIPKSILEHVASRIPHQGPSSMVLYEVVGFLPKGVANIAFVPGAITAQMGSDFDVDKLYTYKTPFVRYTKGDKTGLIIPPVLDPRTVVTDEDLFLAAKRFQKTLAKRGVKISIKDAKNVILSNSYVAVHKYLLKTKDFVKKSLKPLDQEGIANAGEARKNKDNKNIKMPFGFNYQQNALNTNKDGKVGVGIFSNVLTTNAALSKGNLRMPFTIVVPNSKNKPMLIDSLTGRSQNTEGEDRADLIRDAQTQSVDNANNQKLGAINLTKDTFGWYSMLGSLSDASTMNEENLLTIEYIAKILTQPFVKDLINYVNTAKLSNKFASKETLYQKFLESILTKEQIADFDVLTERYLDENNLAGLLVTEDQLIDMATFDLTNYGDIKKSEVDFSKYRLVKLLTTLNQATTLYLKASSLVNKDSRGLGKNLVQAKLDILDALNSVQGIQGFTEFFKDSVYENYAKNSLEALEFMSNIYTPLSNFYTDNVLELYKSLLPNLTPTDVLKLHESTIKTKHIQAASFAADLNAEPINLVATNRNFLNTNSSSYAPAEVLRLKALYPNNKFLRSLTERTIRYDNRVFNLVVKNPNVEDKTDDLTIQADFLALYNNPEHKTFMTRLVYYNKSILSSALFNFDRFIPGSVLEELNYNKAATALELNYNYDILLNTLANNKNLVIRKSNANNISTEIKLLSNEADKIKAHFPDAKLFYTQYNIGETTIKYISSFIIPSTEATPKIITYPVKGFTDGFYFTADGVKYVKVPFIGIEEDKLPEFLKGSQLSIFNVTGIKFPTINVVEEPITVLETTTTEVNPISKIDAASSINEFAELLKEEASTNTYKDLALKLTEILNNQKELYGFNVGFEYKENNTNVLGTFVTGTNPKIVLAKSKNKQSIGKALTKTFSHEAVHAITKSTIKAFFANPTLLKQTNPEAYKAVENLLELYNHSKVKLINKKNNKMYKYIFGNEQNYSEEVSLEYNLNEFIAHLLTDEVFQEWLNNQESPEGFEERKSLLSSIVQTIIDLVKGLFGVNNINEGFVFDDALLEAVVLLNNAKQDFIGTETNGENSIDVNQNSIDFPHLTPKDNKLGDKFKGPYGQKLNNLYNAYYRARELASNPKIGNDKKAFEQQADFIMEAIKASINQEQTIDANGNVVEQYITNIANEQLTTLLNKVQSYGQTDASGNTINLTPQEVLFANQQADLWEDALDLLADIPAKDQVILNITKLKRALEDVIYSVYIDNINNAVPFEELKTNREKLERTTPIGTWATYTLDMSRTDNTMLTTLDLLLKNAARDVNGEYQDAFVPKAEALKKALAEAGFDSSKQETWDNFLQKDEEGNLTGLVVSRFNDLYYSKIQQNLNSPINYKTKSGVELTKGQKASVRNTVTKNRLKWVKQNLEVVDITYLEELDPTIQADLKQKAIDNLLSKGLNVDEVQDLIAEAEQKYDKYQRQLILFTARQKDKYKLDIEDPNLDLTDVDIQTTVSKIKDAILAFKVRNNPVYVINRIKNFKGDEAIVAYTDFSFISYTPNPQSKNYSKYLDNQYKVVEGNKALSDYYKFFVRSMTNYKKLIPNHNLKGIPRTYVPEIMKDLYEDAIRAGGLSGVAASIKAPFMKAFAANNWLSKDKVNSDNTFDTEGNRIRTVPVTGLSFTQKRLQNKIKKQTSLIEELKLQAVGSIYKSVAGIEYKISPELFQIEEQRLAYMQQELKDFLKIKSFNIDDALNNFVLTTLNYKHKSSVEPIILLGQAILNKAKADLKTPSGNNIVQRGINIADKKSLENVVKMLDYNINAILYNERKLEEGVLKNQEIKTSVDGIVQPFNRSIGKLKEKIAALKAIKEEDLTLEQQRDLILLEMELHYTKRGSLTTSKILDQVVKIQQLKSLGLDPFQASADFTASFMQLTIQATGGLNFTGKHLTNAFGVMMSSTANLIGFKNKQAAKVVKLINKFSLVGELIEANYGTSQTELTKKWGLDPFGMLRATNFFNTGLLMVSNLMAKKITINGKEISLWEAFDNDGNFIDQTNKDWAGSFDTENENSEIRKLRNSLIQQLKQVTGNADVNSPILAKKYIIGRLLGQFRLSWIPEGIAARFEKEKFDAQLGINVKGRYKTLWTVLGKVRFNNVQHLASLAVFSKANGYQLSDLDLANMRKNFAELYWMFMIGSSMFLLAKLADDDDEKAYAATLIYNQLNRVMSDIKFYFSPQTAEDIIKNPIPAMKVYKDAARAITAIKNYIDDEEGGYDYDAEYLTNRVLSPFPYVNLYPKSRRQFESIIDK